MWSSYNLVLSELVHCTLSIYKQEKEFHNLIKNWLQVRVNTSKMSNLFSVFLTL